MSAMAAECSLVYALVDEIRQRNEEQMAAITLMVRAMQVHSGLEQTKRGVLDGAMFPD